MCQAFEQDTWELISQSEGQQRMDISNMGSLNTLVLAGALDCSFWWSILPHASTLYTCIVLPIILRFTSLTSPFRYQFFFCMSLHFCCPVKRILNVLRINNMTTSTRRLLQMIKPIPCGGAWRSATSRLLGSCRPFKGWRCGNLPTTSFCGAEAREEQSLMKSWWILVGFDSDLIGMCYGYLFDFTIFNHFNPFSLCDNVIVHLRLAGKERPVKAYLDWLFVGLSTVDDPWLY